MKRLPTVKECCCCCSLKAGTISLAVIALVLGLGYISKCANSLQNRIGRRDTPFSEADKIKYIVGIITGSIYAIFGFIMLIGACTKNVCFLKFCVILSFIALVTEILVFVTTIILHFLYTEIFYELLITVFVNSLYFAIQFYLLLVVNSYALSIAEDD
ncbi:uncharacterized protein LOC106666367 [Cimex lectularius]|uniref:Uncharacterized protein n=1 Tax=Cimex lectularius TaxID=79782 RepID=A0A8I6RM25_CIMLE|nr:uncharacterized protein LOC106666367 [Cimex lectularius]